MTKTEMNYRKLKATIVLNGFTQDEVIQLSKINRSRFYRVLRGEDEFDRGEIVMLSKVLELSDGDIIDIFFANKVS